MPLQLIPRLRAYLDPLILLSISLVYLPITLISHPLLPLKSPSKFRSLWFANFWKVLGPQMAASPEQAAYCDELMSRAHGIVLELGPGSGDQMYHFQAVAGRIDRVYGAEPNRGLHEKLTVKASENGLGGGKYVVLECGAEPNSLLPALKRAGLLMKSGDIPEGGVFDTIVAVKSMCSVRPAEMQAILLVVQALLKPRGEFVFFEHVENHSDLITKLYVGLLELIWPWCMGGCRMTSRIDRIALGMSGWVPSVQTTAEFQGYNCFRYVKGVCRKK